MNLATCYNYKGHTIYTDGRLYKAGELVGTYKTEAAAMADTGRRALSMAHPVTAAVVRNRHGAPVLEVRFFARPYSGPAAFEFIDVQDNDITAQVRRAIQTSKGVH